MKTDREALLQVIDRFSGVGVAVWGDYILDEYIYGNTRRISREAPVLILSYRSREYSLGGAGNAVLNLKHLGANPLPIGILGLDEAGDKVVSLLKSHDISTSLLSRNRGFFTPIKTRILGGEDNTRKQQILRIDRESSVPESAGIRRRLKNALERTAPRCRALLVSDYNYMGVKVDLFAEILPVFKQARIPVTVDSRFRLVSFDGATLATPNEPEVEEALKVEARGKERVLDEAALAIMKKCRLQALLITRGSNGMTLYERGKAPHSIPISGSKDIVDVTGAGDTVISVFTLAISAGATFRQAALLANHAGGIVVMKKGAATLTPEELRQAVLLSH